MVFGLMSGLTTDQVAAVERAADAYVAAMNAADRKRVAQSFAEGAVRVPPHEEPHQGRDAIEAWLGDEGDFLEIWRRELDGVWRVAEAMWNTRLPYGGPS
jgi:ketosteroid isomerase-like protein